MPPGSMDETKMQAWADETKRQASVVAYGLSGTQNWEHVDARLHRLATVGQKLLGYDVRCGITIVDDDRVWAIIGERDEPISVSTRSASMCHRVIAQTRSPEVVVIPDATLDPRTADSPWVNGDIGATKFYAAAPLIGREGYALGAFCMWTDKARCLAVKERQTLTEIRDAVIRVLAERRFGKGGQRDQ